MITLPMNTLTTALGLLISIMLIKDTQASVLSAASLSSTSTQPILTIDLSNLKESARHNSIFVAIHRATDQWSDEPLFKIQLANATLLPLQISDLAAGHYAIRLFIDSNENGQLDLNAKGLPTEPFGFSGVSKIRRMPTVSEAVFELTKDSQQTLKIMQPRTKK